MEENQKKEEVKALPQFAPLKWRELKLKEVRGIAPLQDFILIQPINKGEEKTKLGIIIPPTEQKKQLQGQYGLVIAIGKDVENIEVGQTVFFTKYSGTDIETADGNFRQMRERELWGHADIEFEEIE